MRTLLTLLPMIVASVLISCGPGITGEDGDNIGEYAGEIVSIDDLVFYARMDESKGSVSDFFGRMIGAPIGIPAYGKMGGMQGGRGPNSSIEFDGTNCVYFGENDNLKLQFPFTLIFLINTQPQASPTIMGVWGNTGSHSWRLQVSGGPNVDLRYSNDGISDLPTGGMAVTPGQWHQLAYVVKSNGFVDMYRDGTIWTTNQGPMSGLYNPPGTGLTLGCEDGNFGFGGEINFAGGFLDEVAIYKRELTDIEIYRINQARF